MITIHRTRQILSPLLRGVCLVALATAFGAGEANAKTISLSVDHGYNLTLKNPAASVFIANPEIADVQVMSPTSIMLFGKRTGETSFMATDSHGRTLEQSTVSVTQDLSGLRAELNNAIPGNHIRASAVPNGLVLTGTASDAATATDAYKIAQRYLSAGGDIINRIQISGSNQIMIRVRFAEVTRNLDNSLGINWDTVGQVGGFAFGLATGVTGVTGGSSVVSTRPNNTGLNLPNDVIGIGHAGQHFNVNALVDALAQDGLITILAEPNLTAMSGETAYFLAGGEFPIPIPQGNGTISISFKNYGISLAFTPTLLNENRIALHVKPEVSQLTSTGAITLDNIAVPALTTRRAETTVEVGSGQSFAIAGLLDNSQTQTINKYPLLGDLPVLGALFRSDRFQSGQSELVIIITPYIVTPSGKMLALPTDGFGTPSEADRYIDQRYSASDPNVRPMSGDPVAVPSPALQPAWPARSSLAPTPQAAPVSPVSSLATPTSPVLTRDPPAARDVPAATASSDDRAPSMQQAPMQQPPMQPLPSPIKLQPGLAAPQRLTPGDAPPAGPAGFVLE